MSSSPSEFLTFYRLAARSQCLRYRPVSRLPATRTFATSVVRRADTGNPNIVTDKGTQQDTGSGGATGGSREHAMDKGNKADPNVQSYETKAGREYVHHSTPFMNLRTGDESFEGDGEAGEVTYADILRQRRSRASDTGGHATRGADERNSTARAKKDHPEAPDVVIGMQDERGGKGA